MKLEKWIIAAHVLQQTRCQQWTAAAVITSDANIAIALQVTVRKVRGLRHATVVACWSRL